MFVGTGVVVGGIMDVVNGSENDMVLVSVAEKVPMVRESECDTEPV